MVEAEPRALDLHATVVRLQSNRKVVSNILFSQIIDEFVTQDRNKRLPKVKTEHIACSLPIPKPEGKPTSLKGKTLRIF